MIMENLVLVVLALYCLNENITKKRYQDISDTLRRKNQKNFNVNVC